MFRVVTRGFVFGYKLIVLVPAFFLSAFMLFAFSALVLFMTAVFSLYRGLWCFSKRGRIARYEKNLKIRKEQIARKGICARAKLSQKADRQNIHELVSMTRKALNRRKAEVAADRLVLTRILLRDCVNESDFDRTKQIYDVISQTDPGEFNDALGKLVTAARN